MTSQAHGIANNAQRIADDMFGGRPEETSAGSVQPPRSPGAVGSLNAELSSLSAALDRLNLEVERLACL